MIMPVGAESFSEGLRMCAEIYHELKKILKENKMTTAVGDEGGFAPDLKDSKEVLEFIVEAVKKAGYQPDRDIKLSLIHIYSGIKRRIGWLCTACSCANRFFNTVSSYL